MSHNNIKKEVLTRNCKCKRCEKMIPRGSTAIAWRGVAISPNWKHLFFHMECLEEMVKVCRKEWYNNE